MSFRRALNHFWHNAETSQSLPPQEDHPEVQSRALVQNALDNPNDQQESERLLDLPLDQAKFVLEEVWKLTLQDPPGPQPRTRRNRMNRISVRLSQKHDILPSSLSLTDVQCTDPESQGTGAFADVFSGVYRGSAVALKRLRVFTGIPDSKKQAYKRSFHREVLLWGQLRHSYILPFLGVSEDSFSQKTPCMVLPWMSNGSIRGYMDKLQTNGRLLSEPYFSLTVNTWVFQIADGLAYLHQEGIVHGDLHGGNILVDDSGNVQLTDFGMSVIAEATPYNYASMHGGGAMNWTAPELFDPDGFGLASTRPTCASDVYSFSLICIELYTAQKPFPEFSRPQLLHAVLKNDRPPRPILPDGGMLSTEVWTVLTQCWLRNPPERLQSDEVARRLAIVASSELPPEKDGQWTTIKYSHSHPVDPPGADNSSPVKHLLISEGHVIANVADNVRVFSVKTGELSYVFKVPARGMNHADPGSALPSPTIIRLDAWKHVLVAACSDRTIRVWNLNTGRFIHVFQSYQGVATFNIARPMLMIGENDNGAVTRKITPQKPLLVVGSRRPQAIGGGSRLCVLTLPLHGTHPNGKQGPSEWNVKQNPFYLHDFQLDDGEVMTCFYAQAGIVASANEVGAVKVWDSMTGKLMLTINTGAPDRAIGVGLDVQRSILCTSLRNGTVHIWDINTGQRVRSLELTQLSNRDIKNPPEHEWDGEHIEIVSPYVVFPGGHGFPNNFVWDMTTGKTCSFSGSLFVGTVSPDDGDRISCASSHDLKFITVSNSGIRWWDVKNTNLVGKFGLKSGVEPQMVEFNERFCVVLTTKKGSQSREIHVWKFCA